MKSYVRLAIRSFLLLYTVAILSSCFELTPIKDRPKAGASVADADAGADTDADSDTDGEFIPHHFAYCLIDIYG